MPLIKPVIRNGIIVVGLASTLFFAHTTQAVWNGQPYTPGSTLNPECSPTQINCTVAPYTLQNITDQGYTTNRPIRVNGVSTTANILPTSNNLYDLGDVSNYWHRLFANNVSSTNIDALGYVSTTALWVNGSPVTSNIPTLQQVTDQGYVTTNPIRVNGVSSTAGILPTSHGVYDFGSFTTAWKDLYASGTAYTAGLKSTYTASGTTLTGLVRSELASRADVSGSYSATAIFGRVTPLIRNGVTNSNNLNGTVGYVLRNNADDQGTAVNLMGLTSVVGHFGATSRTSNNVYGAKITPYAQGGTISSLYGLYVDVINGAGTVNNKYGVYVADTSMQNYFGGNVGLGTTNPYLFKLTVAGSIAPSTTNSYDLGGTANYWRKLFVKNVSSTNIDALGYVSTTKLVISKILPQTDSATAIQFFQTNGTIRVININTTDTYDGTGIGTGTGIYGAPRIFLGTNSPSGDDSAILVGRRVEGDSLFSHAFRDESTFHSSTTGAYASFDSIPVVNGSIEYNHLASFQSRQFYNGTGQLDASVGYTYSLTANGHVLGAYGARIYNPTGTGTIDNFYGIYIEPIYKPTNSFAIYSAATSTSYLAGKLGIGTNSPVSLLSVQGDVTSPGVFSNTDNGQINISSAGNYANKYQKITFSTPNYAGTGANAAIGVKWTGVGTFMKFGTSNSYTGVNNAALVINPSGNVGIGVDSPSFFTLQVAGSVGPSSTNMYDLGSSSYYWRKLFVNNVSSTNVDADGYISAAKLLINGTEVVTANPNLQQVTDQGAITNKWIRFAGATSTGSINPTITNLYDLGSNTNAWRGIYASTSLNVGSSSFKVDQNGAAIGDGTINNKLSINQLNSNNALLKLSSSALTPGLSYAAAIDFYSNYPGTTNTFNFSKIYTRSDCGLWICGRLTLSVRDNNGDMMDGLTLKGSSNEAAKINIGIGTNNPYLYRLTVDGTVAPSTTNSYDLGSAEHSWRNIYATSTIYSSNSQGTGNLVFATSGAMYANATDINSAAFIFQNKSSGAGALFAIADNLNNYPLLINNDNNTFFGWTPSISGSNRVIIAGNGNRADGDLGFAATSTDNSTFYRWSIGVDKSDGGKFKISSSTALGTNDRLTIDGNGNVGIGTSNPSNFKLQIAGNIGPDANLTYDLGSSDNRWKDLYVSSTHIGTSTWDLWQANTGFTISKGLENQYITVSNNGNLGIGTTIPNQGRVEVKGDTVCVDTNNDGNASSCITSESDARLKKNTLEIDGALNKIMQLTGVTYDWKTDDPEVLKHYPLISRFKGYEHTVGLIAQDVQKIFPEALSLETVGDKDVQYYQLDYTKFTPLIIEAIKEQQDQINSLKESQALFTNSSPLGPTQPVIESQAGQAKFLLSQDVIPVIFKMAFNDIPVVTVTPMDKIEGPYWIEKVSATGFEIHLAFAQPKDVIFNWQALYNNNQSFPDYINPPPDYTPPPPIQDPKPTNVTTTTPAPMPTTTSTPPEPVNVPVTTTQDQATSTSN